MLFKAKFYTMVAGKGRGKTQLTAFDNALQYAKVGDYNLIKVSSILPPKAEESKNIVVEKGSILPIAYGNIVSEEIGKEIVAAVGVGIPKNQEEIGVIMEYSGYEGKEQAELKVKNMIEEAMENRKIEILEIKCISSSCIIDSGINCVFAGIALW